MSAIFQRMLENVDDTLFDIAGHSQSMEDRRNLFDAMRMLRKSARPLIESFEAALQGQKAAGAAAKDFEEWELVNDEAVEADIVISRVVARIEDAAKQALWEYTIRMENLPAAAQQDKSFERLRPPGITKAFRDSVESVSIDPSTKLILFKLFERQLVSDSSTVYEGINLRLEAAGVSSKTLSRRDPNSHLPPGQPERRDPPEFVASYVNHVAPSYQIPAALSSVVSSAFGPAAGGGGGMGYGGVPGVAGIPGAMGAAAGPGPALHGPGGQQRLSLVAQLLLDQTRNWDSGQSQAATTQLLVPLLRIALADPGFFADPQHPARAVLSSLVGAPNGADDRLAEVADRLNSLASGVQDAGPVAPLSGAQLRQFLLSQRSAGASTSARLEEGRAAAYQQIRTVGSGRDLPVGVSGFLNQIWLPMISAMHLKFGAESEEMRRAAQILQRLFGEVRWLPEMKDSAVIQAILEELEKGLRDIAVPAPLITKARTVLADGLGQPETTRKLLDLETLAERASTAAPAAANDAHKPEAPAAASKPAAFMGDDAAWRAALPVSSWFRVFDRASDQTQWLSAGVFYPQSRTLAFNGFDGAARLSIERGLFLEDLVGGKAEAVDPTELQQSSIRLLCLEFTASQKQSGKSAAKAAS